MNDDLQHFLDVFGADVARLAEAVGRLVTSPAPLAPGLAQGLAGPPARDEPGGKPAGPGVADLVGQLFGRHVAAVVSAVQSVAAALVPVRTPFQQVGEAAAKAVPPIQQAGEAMQACAQAVSQLVSRLGGALTALPAREGTVSPAPPGLSPGSGEAPGLGLGMLGAAVGGAVTAVTAAVGAVQGAIGAVRGFVEALAPSTILAFDQAVRDLQATIGVAFEPIFQILANAFRQVAGIILPLMEQLRPVVAQLAQVFAGQLVSSVKNAVAVIEALVPVLQTLATLVEVTAAVYRPMQLAVQALAAVLGANLQLLSLAFAPVVESLKVAGAVLDGLSDVLDVVILVFRTAVQTVMQFVKSLFGFDFQDVFRAIADATKKVIENLLIFTATLAKFFGADKFLANLIENLKPKAGVAAAAQSPAIKSFEQVANDLALASAAAAGGGVGEKKTDLADVVQTLEAIQRGDEDGKTRLVKVLSDIVEILEWIQRRLGDVETLKESGSRAVTAGSQFAAYLANPASLVLDMGRRSG